jgi:hypothetical protein
MATPPNRRHQRIASNLESLLNAALKRHAPRLSPPAPRCVDDERRPLFCVSF